MRKRDLNPIVPHHLISPSLLLKATNASHKYWNTMTTPISKAAISRKRSRSSEVKTNELDDALCNFCQRVPAALSVALQVRMRKKREATPFCISCYYTTSAVRQPSEFISILDQTHLDQQLPRMQSLFGEVYVELKKELAEESERSFQRQKSDPLAMLHQKSSSRRSFHNKKAGKATDGGFLREVKIPEKILQTQQLQMKHQRAQIERMKQSAKEGNSAPNLFQRRKASRASIWNLAMQKPSPNEKVATASSLLDAHNAMCSCGSTNVSNFGNVTSRNQDMRKGETWGMKDRGDDVVSKYQCNDCGKIWQEEE